MRKNIQRKLKSQDGASLVIALLLFLVCTVVGSVVLTGATAVAGRVSQRRELRQEREALNSAAELIKSSLNLDEKGKTDMTYEATFRYDDTDGSARVEAGSEKFLINSAAPADAFGKMFQTVTQQVTAKLWTTSVNADAAPDGLKDSWPKVTDDTTASTDRTVDDYIKTSTTKSWISKKVQDKFVTGNLTITASGTGSTDFPEIEATVAANQNGNMVITLAKKDASASSQRIEIQLQPKPARLEYSSELSGDAMVKTVSYKLEWEKVTIKPSYSTEEGEG